MESFWKGSFAPMQKHVKSVRLVRLSEMTQADWDVLDYEMLRPSARVAIDEAILDGQLAGFYQVDVDMHKAHRPHGGKSRYFYPAYLAAVQKENVPDPSSFETYPNFDNAVDQDAVDTSPTDRLGSLLFMLRLLSPEQQRDMMDRINKQLPDEEDISIDGLRARDSVLVLAITLFLMHNDAAAKRVLKAVDIVDDEVYALFNDDEPLE
jgi:hypothetical protein